MCHNFTFLSQGDISIGIKCAPGIVGHAEADIDFDIIRNDNDTFTVKYTPPGAGSYTIMVLFADQVSCIFTGSFHSIREVALTRSICEKFQVHLPV